MNLKRMSAPPGGMPTKCTVSMLWSRSINMQKAADASNGTIGACLTPPRSMAISSTSSAYSCAVVGVSCSRAPKMGFSAAATPFVVSISSCTRLGLYFSSVRTTD